MINKTNSIMEQPQSAQLSSAFSVDITYQDESGIWIGIWNGLKDQLNVNFISVKFKESINPSLKNLASLNIKMVPLSDNPLLNICIYKINSPSEVKKDVKERMITNFERFKGSLHINLMDIDNSDSAVK